MIKCLNIALREDFCVPISRENRILHRDLETMSSDMFSKQHLNAIMPLHI